MTVNKFQLQWAHFRQNLNRFTWGGAWASTLSSQKRRNLTRFFFDGLFSAASDRIILTYLTIYLLSLGATRQQIGFFSSLSNLSAALLLLPAALLVERTHDRKKVTLLSASASRLVLFSMALLPLMQGFSQRMIWVILALALVREACNNIGYPGWMALIGDIIPMEGRGRYFGTRNFMMGVAGMITALVIGNGITRFAEPLGYQLAFIVAALLGVISISFFARIQDPLKNGAPREQTRGGLRQILSSLKGQTSFIRFLIFTALWNFSINIVGPFFNVYMVDTLKLTAAMIGVTTVANTMANLLVQRRVGVLADRWGNRKVATIFLLLIPLMTVAWGLWIRQYWHAIVISAVGGIVWGSYNLVSFNNLLFQTPEYQRARFSAFYQMIVTLALAAGAALGSFLIPIIDFKGVALASAVGRWLAAILFIVLVRDSPQNNPEPTG